MKAVSIIVLAVLSSLSSSIPTDPGLDCIGSRSHASDSKRTCPWKAIRAENKVDRGIPGLDFPGIMNEDVSTDSWDSKSHFTPQAKERRQIERLERRQTGYCCRMKLYCCYLFPDRTAGDSTVDAESSDDTAVADAPPWKKTIRAETKGDPLNGRSSSADVVETNENHHPGPGYVYGRAAEESTQGERGYPFSTATN